MRRVYTEVSRFRAPYSYETISFAGLGSLGTNDWNARQWPKGRSYYDVSKFRAPYEDGYYQSGGLRGWTAVFSLAGEMKALAAGVGASSLLGAVVGALTAPEGQRGVGFFGGAFKGAAFGTVAVAVSYQMRERAT